MNGMDTPINAILREWRDLWPGGLEVKQYSVPNPGDGDSASGGLRPTSLNWSCQWLLGSQYDPLARAAASTPEIAPRLAAVRKDRFSLYPPDSGCPPTPSNKRMKRTPLTSKMIFFVLRGVAFP